MQQADEDDLSKLKVAELRERLEALGAPTTGLKKVLVERLQGLRATSSAGPSSAPIDLTGSGGASSSNAPSAPIDLTGDDDGDPPPASKKARGKRAAPAPSAESKESKESKKPKTKGKAKADAPAAPAAPTAPPPPAPPAAPASSDPSPGNAGWFYAKDAAPGAREWAAYDEATRCKLEVAVQRGDARLDIDKERYADLSSGKPGKFQQVCNYVQRRIDNPNMTRPIARTKDGKRPTAPPPSGAAAAPRPKSVGSPVAGSGGGNTVSMKGGVQQVRFGVKSTGGGAGGKSVGGNRVRTEVVKGRAAVDSSCPIAESTHVYEEGSTVFDALLNQTDIANNRNKYYLIQLLETDDGSKNYYGWTKWGRVGEEQAKQNALRGPMSLAQAKAEFCDKFEQKTANAWQDRERFATVPGKYTLLQRDYGSASSAAPAAAPSSSGGGPSRAVESALDARVQKFVALICDLRMMEQHMREIGFDAEKMPLGKLKKETILQGYRVLKQLSQIVVGGSGGASSGSASSGGAGFGGRREEILQLSNAFYSLIPHVSYDEKGGTRAQLPMLNTAQMIKDKVEMIEALGSIELASKIIDTGAGSGFDVHPIDARYAELRSRLTPVERGTPLHTMLEQYMKRTHAATHSSYTLELLEAFEIEREGEAAAFTDVGNRQLLWHGSRLTNWCGILSQGLRIAPPEAPVTGYMFGKGVYFADMVSKSANYCFATGSSDVGVISLSEVALGGTYDRLQAEYTAAESCKKAGKHATWGKGKTAPDPAGDTTLPGDAGLKVPMGQGKPTGVKDSSLLYNEFIVYDTKQIKQRFVLMVKFHFARGY